MKQLMDILTQLPEYRRLAQGIEKNQALAVSGAAQIARSHLIATLCHHSNRPAVLIFQDEMAARRAQEELNAFLGREPELLPTRDLTFHHASAIRPTDSGST